MGKKVAIVAMGESRNDFLMGRLLPETAKQLAECEVWAINYMAAEIRCDRMIAMDPFDPPESIVDYPPGQIEYLKKTQLPIVSCRAVPGFNITEYPLKGVVEELGGFAYFNTTVSYAIALAIYEKAEQILLFGCDFTYPHLHDGESGRACAEFWLGIAMSRGIGIVISANSSLMDQNIKRKLYGYPDESQGKEKQ